METMHLSPHFYKFVTQLYIHMAASPFESRFLINEVWMSEVQLYARLFVEGENCGFLFCAFSVPFIHSTRLLCAARAQFLYFVPCGRSGERGPLLICYYYGPGFPKINVAPVPGCWRFTCSSSLLSLCLVVLHCGVAYASVE